ncbi:unnamed protein product (macronuclear) [Paramecium tetraurelia]|uniref:Transmembrane protein n=1 Tax=Paramecium tetraurelia TaxID=5888 RepID=A0DX04_PARTE|nr:uncharacterized protein GSPATT00021203001 [Paramecium tetraurelia]CAK87571.1 unnamed protein product [Paramecium tetraurelia]|eukprot:XP_001454968.1 hypothetical protein (macronuclear) [Paramecium tetraurelia strain d4-2]
MESDSKTKSQSEILPEMIYNYYKFPADLKKAELHGKSFKVYEKSMRNSPQCLCCDYYQDHIKFSICSDLRKSDICEVASDYFEMIKWMIANLASICIIVVPYALYRNHQGNLCEMHPNCNQNSLKIFTIWNITTEFYNLNEFIYPFLLLLSAFIHYFYCTSYFCTQQLEKIFKLIIATDYQDGVYFPDLITNEQVLEFLRENSQNSIYFQVKDLKSYEQNLFDILKSPYLGESQKVQVYCLAFFQQKKKNDTKRMYFMIIQNFRKVENNAIYFVQNNNNATIQLKFVRSKNQYFIMNVNLMLHYVNTFLIFSQSSQVVLFIQYHFLQYQKLDLI